MSPQGETTVSQLDPTQSQLVECRLPAGLRLALEPNTGAMRHTHLNPGNLDTDLKKKKCLVGFYEFSERNDQKVKTLV